MQNNMDALLQSDEFRDKLRMIPPHLKGVFIKAVEDLYERESEKMLQLIWESRQEMRETFITMEDEQNDLRCQSRMLEEKRREADKSDLKNYLKGRKSRNSRAASRLSTISDITATRGNREDNFGGRHRVNGAQGGPLGDLQLPETSGARAASAGVTHRSAPTPVFVKSIEELRDELFKHLSTAETKVESERERQRELLEWLKAEKRNKQQEKVEKANELLQEVTQMERIKAKDKERQEQRFKERLEEKKKLKEDKERGLTPVESTRLETAIQIEPEQPGAEGKEETPSTEKKEKRKKKKHRHRDEEEGAIGEEDREEKKERRERKKKHKHKDVDKDTMLEIEDEEAKERKKEKKKHRHRHEEERCENPEEQGEEKERRKEKKKHRHRRENEAPVVENGEDEVADSERKESRKEKKKAKKDKRQEESEDAP